MGALYPTVTILHPGLTASTLKGKGRQQAWQSYMWLLYLMALLFISRCSLSYLDGLIKLTKDGYMFFLFRKEPENPWECPLRSKYWTTLYDHWHIPHIRWRGLSYCCCLLWTVSLCNNTNSYYCSDTRDFVGVIQQDKKLRTSSYWLALVSSPSSSVCQWNSAFPSCTPQPSSTYLEWSKHSSKRLEWVRNRVSYERKHHGPRDWNVSEIKQVMEGSIMGQETEMCQKSSWLWKEASWA